MTGLRRGLAAILVVASLCTSAGAVAGEPPCASDTPVTGAARHRLVAFIAERWNLGVGYAKQVVHAAYEAAQQHGVEPLTVLAVAAKESAFRHLGNPGGGQDPRRPFGIMQVAGKWHKEKFENGVVRPTSMTENIRLGAWALGEYMDLEDGDERRALLRYNGSLASKGGYSDSVLRTKQLLGAVADGCRL